MRWLKIAGTALIIGSASAILWHCTVVPWRCNLRLRLATNTVNSIFSTAPNSIRAAQIARETAEELRPCVAACPANVGAQMVMAACYRALGLNRQAIAFYETALRYDRRPELYLNLGQTQLAIGDSKSALRNLTLACIYNPAYLDDVGRYHPEVKHAVDEYQLQLARTR